MEASSSASDEPLPYGTSISVHPSSSCRTERDRRRRASPAPRRSRTVAVLCRREAPAPRPGREGRGPRVARSLPGGPVGRASPWIRETRNIRGRPCRRRAPRRTSGRARRRFPRPRCRVMLLLEVGVRYSKSRATLSHRREHRVERRLVDGQLRLEDRQRPRRRRPHLRAAFSAPGSSPRQARVLPDAGSQSDDCRLVGLQADLGQLELRAADPVADLVLEALLHRSRARSAHRAPEALPCHGRTSGRRRRRPCRGRPRRPVGCGPW